MVAVVLRCWVKLWVWMGVVVVEHKMVCGSWEKRDGKNRGSLGYIVVPAGRRPAIIMVKCADMLLGFLPTGVATWSCAPGGQGLRIHILTKCDDRVHFLYQW
jgi:hypothetical protein